MKLVRRIVPLIMVFALLAGLGVVAIAHPGHAGHDATSSAAPLEQADQPVAATHDGGGLPRSVVLAAGLTVFVLAVFVGFEVIAKVPPTLHTPLMSGSNAISGITVVGAILAASRPTLDFSTGIAVLAVALAMTNVVGGFVVTNRILRMFKKR